MRRRWRRALFNAAGFRTRPPTSGARSWHVSRWVAVQIENICAGETRPATQIPARKICSLWLSTSQDELVQCQSTSGFRFNDLNLSCDRDEELSGTFTIIPTRICPSAIEPASTNHPRRSRAKVSFTRNLVADGCIAPRKSAAMSQASGA
jgi:hypothetical protein